MTRTRTWLVSGAASIALVSVLAWLADPAVLRLALAPGVLEALLLALVLLQIEGLCTALRVQWLAPGSRFIAALELTGWWVVSLALLPARLGEVAGVHLLVRRLGTTLGSALNSLLMQRLLDALLLALAGATVVAALAIGEPLVPAMILLLGAGIGLWLVLLMLGLFLEPRLAFWVMLGIPISIFGSFLFLPLTGASINMISMLWGRTFQSSSSLR